MSDSIFINDQVINYFNDIADELTQKVTGQKIYFLGIDKETTVVDQLYGGAMKTNFKEPIAVYALINIATWESEMEHGQIKEAPTVEVYLTRKNLGLIGFSTARSVIGQYFVWGERLWEILSCVSKQLVFGEPDWAFGATMNCKQAMNITASQLAYIKTLSAPEPPSGLDIEGSENSITITIQP